MITPKIILGTAQFGLNYGISNKTGKPSDQEVSTILKEAQLAGVMYLDTAEAYGNSLQIIGDFHDKCDKCFEILSKFRYKPQEDLRTAVMQQLSTLRVDKLHALSYHSFIDYKENPHLKIELGQLKQEGIIDNIGISIYSNEQFEEILNDEMINIVQIPYNLLDNWSKRGHLMLKANERNLEVHVRSVYLQGLFFLEKDDFPPMLEPLWKYLSFLRELAVQNEMSLEVMAISYVHSNPFANRLVIGINAANEFLNNIRDIRRLPESLMEEINKIVVEEDHLLNPVNWK